MAKSSRAKALALEEKKMHVSMSFIISLFLFRCVVYMLSLRVIPIGIACLADNGNE